MIDGLWLISSPRQSLALRPNSPPGANLREGPADAGSGPYGAQQLENRVGRLFHPETKFFEEARLQSGPLTRRHVLDTFPKYQHEAIAGRRTASSEPTRKASRSIDRQRRRIDPRVLTNYPGSRAVFIEQQLNTLGLDRPSHRREIVGGWRPLPSLEIMDCAQRDIGSFCKLALRPAQPSACQPER